MVDLLSEKNKSKIQIFLIIIGFLLFIMLSNNLFKGFRFDLTENKLYTLGEGTYNIINKIEDNLVLNYYFSDSLTQEDNYLRAYSKRIKELLEEKFDYIKLIGESGPITIANSGHVYFSIKENDEVISCICWKGTYERLEINLEEGTEYNFFGRVTSYSKFGRSVYQLIIDQVEYSGDGSLSLIHISEPTRPY